MIGRRLYWIILATALVLGACKTDNKDEIYETAIVGTGDVRDVIQATGNLKAKGAVEIRSSNRGVVDEVLVNEGDTVRAGQVLARLKSPTRDPAIRQARARQAAALSATEEIQSRLTTANEKLSRTNKLHESGFVSPAAVTNVRSEVAAANAAVDRALNDYWAATEDVRLALAQGTENDIKAPLDGQITLVSIQPGQTISPDDKTAHFQSMQSSKDMLLEVLIAESDVTRVNQNSQIFFTVDAHPDVQEAAQFKSLGEAPIRDGNFTSYLLTADYKNLFGVMRPGMSASVQVFQANSRSVLRLPRQATHFRPYDYIPPIPPERLEQLKRKYNGDMRSVRAGATGVELRYLIDNGRRVVFVLDKGKPVRREIIFGAMTDEFVEVLSGIKEGEVVIVRDNRDPRRGI